MKNFDEWRRIRTNEGFFDFFKKEPYKLDPKNPPENKNELEKLPEWQALVNDFGRSVGLLGMSVSDPLWKSLSNIAMARYFGKGRFKDGNELMVQKIDLETIWNAINKPFKKGKNKTTIAQMNGISEPISIPYKVETPYPAMKFFISQDANIYNNRVVQSMNNVEKEVPKGLPDSTKASSLQAIDLQVPKHNGYAKALIRQRVRELFAKEAGGTISPKEKKELDSLVKQL